MSELTWKKMGYSRCSKCDSQVPIETLKVMNDMSNKGIEIKVCKSCSDFSCFECGKGSGIKFYSKLKVGGSKWLCRWCSKLYGVIVSE